MGRVVRILMKVPAVRRVMVRLANLEDAVAKQQALLGALDGHRERWSADQVGHTARLADLEGTIARQQALLDAFDGHRERLSAQQAVDMARLADLEDAVAGQQASLAALEGHRERLSADQAGHGARLEQAAAALHDQFQRQQARLVGLGDAVQAQRTEIDALLAQVRKLGIDNDRSGILLAEVAQHLPPAQRANLEATLHGQQLQLGALNSTVNAQQMQLAVLNGTLTEVAQQLSPGRQANLEATLHGQQLQLGALNSTANAQQMQLAALNDIIRGMTAGREAKPVDTPKPIDAARDDRPARAPVDSYTFDQLLNRRVEKQGLDLVFNIHVPKAAGNTVNVLFRQMGFLLLSLDMSTNEFFRTVREDRWFEGYEAPPPRLNAYLMTGHMRLDQPIFRRLWMPHIIISMLRDPLERMLSHYNFTLRLPDNPWHAEVTSGQMSFLEYAGKMLDAIGPQYGFFDHTGRGIFARTGTATAQECLANLLTKVSFYGLCDRFDEFAVLSGYLVGRKNFLAVAPANVTGEIEDQGGGLPLKTELADAEREALTTMLRDDIWFYQQAVKEYEKRVADSRLQALFSQMLPVVKSSREAMRGVLAVRDPADPGRRAFARSR